MTNPAASNLDPRNAALTHVRQRLIDEATPIEGGPRDGEQVVRLDQIDWVFAEPLPPTPLFGAEVRTPGRVVVATVCPSCSEVATITMTVTSELRVDPTHSTLRLSAKAKPATHTCGQISAELDEPDLGLEEISRDDSDPDEDREDADGNVAESDDV